MEFIWWAPFKDRIGSAGTFALAMRGSETVAARACPACHAEAFGEGRERSRTGHRLRFLISNFYFLLSSSHSSPACRAVAHGTP